MSKILNYKNMNLIQKIILYIIALVIIAIITWILKTISINKKLERKAIVSNYNEIKDYTHFIYQGTTTNDRQIYWDLNDIISKYITSIIYEGDNAEFNLEDYFDALTDEYKNYLGKSKYLEISKNFINKFLVNSAQETSYKTHDIIENIYDIQNDMYFCELRGTNENKAYIGIKLDRNVKTYQIFYIE